MIDLNKLIDAEIEKGYGYANAEAKVCQDIILKAISMSSLNRNITIKGGVVMRSKTNNIRRATQDLDLDFIKYSIEDESIDKFISVLNCLEGIIIQRHGQIEKLKQQDYSGKRIYIEIKDLEGNSIISKLDLGVHNRLDIKQEEYCFDVCFDEEGASLLINSSEQMFVEKLRSLLRFGAISTRYKDIFDMYFLMERIDKQKLMICLNSYIYNDPKMREMNNFDVIKRVKRTFENREYVKHLYRTNDKWLDEDIKKILNEIIIFIGSI